MGTLNKIITEVAIALKQNKDLSELELKYGSENIADAIQFIQYDNRETIEVEEDYEFGKNM